MNYFDGVNLSSLEKIETTKSKMPKSAEQDTTKKEKSCNPEDILNAVNAQGLINKPFVTTTNQITFEDNGSIIADRRKMTVQNGKVQFGKPVAISLPIDKTLSTEDNKQEYINTMLSNSKNILNCVFLAKDSDGTDVQISIQADKSNPYKISVSKRKDIKDKFEADTVNTFNKSIGTSDDAIKTVIQAELEKYGFENLKQFAIANKD